MSGAAARAGQAAEQARQHEAIAWAARLEPVPEPLLAGDVLATLEQFASQVIAPMVLIGTAFRRAIDAGLDASTAQSWIATSLRSSQ
jgi:hypothetical protein